MHQFTMDLAFPAHVKDFPHVGATELFSLQPCTDAWARKVRYNTHSVNQKQKC